MAGKGIQIEKNRFTPTPSSTMGAREKVRAEADSKTGSSLKTRPTLTQGRQQRLEGMQLNPYQLPADR